MPKARAKGRYAMITTVYNRRPQKAVTGGSLSRHRVLFPRPTTVGHRGSERALAESHKGTSNGRCNSLGVL